MNLPRWTREPLVHFFVAGALIFGLFAMRGEEVDPASRSITVSREQQAQLALMFERTMGRAPTDAELDNQVDRFVRDEVLYREALRMGLDRGDAVVRRRMAQKMDMLASARAEATQPGEDELRAWYSAHGERFSSEASYSFDQLWFDSEAAARAARAQVAGGEPPQGLGQSVNLPRSVDAMPAAEVVGRFGIEFVEELAPLKPGDEWQGPLPSGLGWHLVRLRQREAGSVPPFEEVRGQVENDWRSSTMAAREDAAYRLLRDAYSVKVER
ncbi:peptidyl-prolyl cis-trans isomerase [Altererythrobacter sp. Z27]|uniref:peptidyl-prolyl cis-trans isomerase n=1 Tax=Altererythrobacter sp. Z27 TaxID=3461147 RepID=UPI0040450C57